MFHYLKQMRAVHLFLVEVGMGPKGPLFNLHPALVIIPKILPQNSLSFRKHSLKEYL